MHGRLISTNGSSTDLDPARIAELVAGEEDFWIDLESLDEDGARLLTDTFGFHELAVEDAEHFGQRPKLDAYDNFALLVVFGVTEGARVVEVHCFYTERFLVTVHDGPCLDLDAVVTWLRHRNHGGNGHALLLYRILDTLIDGFFPVLADFDDEIDELEDDILARPTDAQLGRLFDMKRSLIALRKVVTPQRDLFAGLLAGRSDLPGMNDDTEHYFRDLYDHLIRISDLVDSYRDLLSGALDTHLSTVSNRLNVVMKQLTIIATIFLPLTFLTGFFGQNFAWLVNHVSGLAVFIGFGIGLPVLSTVVFIVLFRVRGWLAGESDAAERPATRPRLSRDQRWRVIARRGDEQGAPLSPP